MNFLKAQIVWFFILFFFLASLRVINFCLNSSEMPLIEFWLMIVSIQTVLSVIYSFTHMHTRTYIWFAMANLNKLNEYE